MLESGFTTVRDVGNAGDYLDADLEKAIRFGVVPGPTMIFAGRIIAPYGGQFWDTPADGRLLENAEYRFADSRDELRKAVRENIYWAARVIKLVVDGQRYIYSTEDIRFVVEEARTAGVPVAAHVQTERGARAAIEAGVASIEHGWELSDDTLALARKNNVSLVSTDFTVASLLAMGMTAERAAQVHARYVARLRRARDAGVTVVFGTDAMADVPEKTRGQMSMEHIDSFVEAGFGARNSSGHDRPCGGSSESEFVTGRLATRPGGGSGRHPAEPAPRYSRTEGHQLRHEGWRRPPPPLSDRPAAAGSPTSRTYVTVTGH